MRRFAEIHLLIQRPRFDANPLWRIWIAMVDADTAVGAKDTASDSSRLGLALEMTNVFLG